MAAASWNVTVGDASTQLAWQPAIADPLGVTYVLAHGAGGHMDHSGVLTLADTLRRKGFDVARFNFLYRAAGKGPPDPMPRLKACYRAALDSVRQQRRPAALLIGGHSMGGRVASMLAADAGATAADPGATGAAGAGAAGDPSLAAPADGFDGLMLLAYPLHPPGKPQRLRAAHLPAIRRPVLCVNGTRDTLCNRELMNPLVANLPNWTMHWLEAADHGYRVLKRSGRTAAGVQHELGEACRRWAREILRG